MPRRVKTFEEEESINNLDDAINAWIEVNVEGVGGGVIDCTFNVVQENDQGRYTALMIYDIP